jgi:uncharacterized membrane protein YeaQ/YmgE (transglycosylase-associated protein family)
MEIIGVIVAGIIIGLLGKFVAPGDRDNIPLWLTVLCGIGGVLIGYYVAAALGVEARIVHVPSEAIAAADPEWGAGLLGDKAHSMVFDNAKLRALVPGFVATIPFHRGAREIVAWHDEDPARRQVDAGLNTALDELADQFRAPK